MKSEFKHMSGAGNTFIVGRADKTLSASDVVSAINGNPRPDGQSVEGVLLLRSFNTHSFNADFYNPDGSRGMMCGNGARCIVQFAIDTGVAPLANTIEFTLNDKPYAASVTSHGISVRFPPPISEKHFERGSLDGVDIDVDYVDVASDHVVVLPPTQHNSAVVGVLRHHPRFPNGVNVNIVSDVARDHVTLHTFERGVEAITGACGTGAISTVVALWRKNLTSNSATVTPPSGRDLVVTINAQGNNIVSIDLEGDAEYDQ